MKGLKHKPLKKIKPKKGSKKTIKLKREKEDKETTIASLID